MWLSLTKKFREYFSVVTGIDPFKFTAWRKVKAEKYLNFTIQDMRKIHGESDYAGMIIQFTMGINSKKGLFARRI